MKAFPSAAIFSACLLSVALTGCNSSDDDDSTSESTETTTTSSSSTTTTTTTSTEYGTYSIADSEQESCYDNTIEMTCSTDTSYFYGQDAQNIGSVNAQSYTDNGDDTVTDNITGIMWTQSPDLDGIGNDDGYITSDDKLSSDNAYTACEDLELAGYTDWQLPNIKQLYSLMNFKGMDPENSGDVTTYLVPFIDATVYDPSTGAINTQGEYAAFHFAYGTTDDERIIDSQYATTSKYYNDEGTEMMFGVNFADGRIKGYTEEFLPGQDKTYFVMCMRNNTSYATNDFELTDDETTVTDNATGLMWARDDSGEDYSTGFDYTELDWTDSDDNGLLVSDEDDDDEMRGAMSWQAALDYAQEMNEAEYLGYSDWRLPTIKELHSITEYSESYVGAAIDTDYFYATPITNENGDEDYAFYWSSTTHATDGAIYGSDNVYGGQTDDYGDAGSYVAFGRALGYDSDGASDENDWVDVHGAGAQRSEMKEWDGEDYSGGSGPQYDAVRFYHYVRLVRDAE